MKINRLNYSKTFWVLIIISLISCTKKIDKNITMQNKILCIEDINNIEGLYGGNFGDIVAYDANTFKRFILTNDRYYDYSPTYSKKYNIVIFESLRNYQTYTGLTSQRDLLILDLNTFKIERFDTDKRFKDVNFLHAKPSVNGKIHPDTDNYGPLFNHSGDKMLFYKTWGGLLKTIILYNFTKDEFKIIADSLIWYPTYIWSQNDSLIYYTKDYNSMVDKANEIRRYKIFNGKTDILFKKKNRNYLVNDELNDNLLCISKLLKQHTYEIEIINLNKKITTFEISMEELGVNDIYSPIFKDTKNIIFVGQVNKENYNQYLYNINIETREVTKLSSYGGHKDCLSYIK